MSNTEPAKTNTAQNLRRYMAERAIDAQSQPGVYAETAMGLLLSTYIKHIPQNEPKEGQKPTSVTKSSGRDYLLGTDLLIRDQPRTILKAGPNIMRLDFTTGFRTKDNMPLVTPSPFTKLPGKDHNRGTLRFENGDHIRFGIRIGNGRYAFDNPVVVVGLCSDRFDDPDRLQENIECLYDNIMTNAPKIIRAANTTLTRFHYMTDPAYKARLDKRYSPDVIKHDLPVLVPNFKFLEQESEPVRTRRNEDRTRVCCATVADAMGQLEYDYYGRPKIYFTDIPWKSEMAQSAVEAMGHTPLKITDPDKAYVRDLILQEPVRSKDQSGLPIIVDKNGTRLDNTPYREAIRNLTQAMHDKFSAETAKPGKPNGPDF